MEGEPGGSPGNTTNRESTPTNPAAMEGEPGGSPGRAIFDMLGHSAPAAMEGEPGGSPGRSLENVALTWALIMGCERCLKGGWLPLGFGCQRA